MNINDRQQQIVDEAIASVKGTNKPEELGNTITLGGKVYKIELLPATDGLDLWEYILKRILPSVGTGLDSFKHDDELDGAPTTFAEAFLHLSDKLDGNSFSLISESIFTGATVDGKPLNFNEEFKGNFGNWKKLLTFALQKNFASFFEEGWANGLQDLMGLVSPQFQK